jgi:hypothetical protein
MPASRHTKRTGGSAVALLLTLFWVACSGKSTGEGSPSTSGQGAAGAGTSGRGGISSGDAGHAVGGSRGGGAASDGGGQVGVGAGGFHLPLPGGNSGNGGSPGASGGVAQAGVAGDAGDCDTNALWQALTRAAGATRCDLVDPPPEGDAVDQLHGAVVIDDEGRVVDNTGLTDAAKQGWLSELAGQRWLCLAGSTLGYSCQPIRG